MSGFFDAEALQSDAGLEVERIWERDCDGRERPWVAEQEEEDITVRKRWLVVAVLRRIIDAKGDVM
jgi:EEF1A N-terminal glycine/lysine methyltransferase